MSEVENTDIEMSSMMIIAHSGEARTLAYEALKEAKKGNFDQAAELMKKSEAEGNEAHKTQTDLLVAEANGEKTPFSLLLVHSQDHLMTSMVVQELCKELIELYSVKQDKESVK